MILSLSMSIKSGFKWLLFGSVGNRAFTFVFGIVLARLLLPEDFGLIVTVSVLTGVASMVSSGGMGQSIIRAKEVSESDYQAVFTLQLIICLVWYFFFFIMSPVIASIFSEPLYEDLIKISTLVFFLKPFTYMRLAWLNRNMAFKQRSIINMVTAIVTGLSSIIMAWIGMGVWSLVLSGVIGGLVNNILLIIYTPIELKLSFNTKVMKKHSSFGMKITAIDILAYLSREGKILLISKLSGAMFVGLFNKAESQARLTNDVLMPSMMQPVLRGLAKVQDDLDITKYLLYRAITVMNVITIPFYVVLWWVADVFIISVYGEKWSASVEPLKVLLVSGVFFNVLYPFGTLLSAQDKLSQEVIVSVFRLIITIIACYIGLSWGLIGVAYGVVFSYLAAAIMLYYIVQKTISTKIKDVINALVPGIMLGSILFLVLLVIEGMLTNMKADYPIIYLLFMIFSGGGVYLTLLLYMPIKELASDTEKLKKKLRINVARIMKVR